jgi:AcrR family transcriptional regulator
MAQRAAPLAGADPETEEPRPVASPADVGKRHTEHGRERKQQLLDAAAALFASTGYAATRIEDICRTAGVAKGLFYWYFPTKQALFVELVRTMRHRLRRAQADAMAPDADALVRLRQGTEASVRFIAEHAPYFSFLDVERADSGHAALLREGNDVALGDVRVLVRAAQREGSVPDHDATLLALGVLGAVSSFSHAWRNGHIELEADELASFVGEWVTRALTAPTPDTRR